MLSNTPVEATASIRVTASSCSVPEYSSTIWLKISAFWRE